MKTHIFQAHSMSAAVAQVKAQLGLNALILQTRTVRKGGLFRPRREVIEITAAGDDSPAAFNPPSSHRSASTFASRPRGYDASNRMPMPSLDVPGWLDQDDPAPATIRQRQTAERLQNAERYSTPARPVATGYSGSIKRLSESLLAMHVAESLVHELLKDLPADLNPGSDDGSAALLQRIERLIPVCGPIQPGLPGKPQIVSFIGPTGVGKTTTIAKLAAHYKLQHNASIALLTIDTYRIAAVDQLRTYADILDAPFAVVPTPSDLSHQLARLTNCSLIFVDTTGRSPNNQLRLAELRSFQQAMGPHQTYLVLAATTAYPQIASAIQKFSPLGVNQLVLTKLDEVVSLSPVLNIFAGLGGGSRRVSPLPLSYVTAGQDVPDDIEVASARDLALKILREHYD